MPPPGVNTAIAPPPGNNVNNIPPPGGNTSAVRPPGMNTAPTGPPNTMNRPGAGNMTGPSPMGGMLPPGGNSAPPAGPPRGPPPGVNNAMPPPSNTAPVRPGGMVPPGGNSAPPGPAPSGNNSMQPPGPARPNFPGPPPGPVSSNNTGAVGGAPAMGGMLPPGGNSLPTPPGPVPPRGNNAMPSGPGSVPPGPGSMPPGPGSVPPGPRTMPPGPGSMPPGPGSMPPGPGSVPPGPKNVPSGPPPGSMPPGPGSMSPPGPGSMPPGPGSMPPGPKAMSGPPPGPGSMPPRPGSMPPGPGSVPPGPGTMPPGPGSMPAGPGSMPPRPGSMPPGPGSMPPGPGSMPPGPGSVPPGPGSMPPGPGSMPGPPPGPGSMPPGPGSMPPGPGSMPPGPGSMPPGPGSVPPGPGSMPPGPGSMPGPPPGPGSMPPGPGSMPPGPGSMPPGPAPSGNAHMQKTGPPVQHMPSQQQYHQQDAYQQQRYQQQGQGGYQQGGYQQQDGYQRQYQQMGPPYDALILHKPNIGLNQGTVQCEGGLPRPDYNQKVNQSKIPHDAVQPVSSKYMRFTHGIIPNSQQLTTKVGLPVGVIIRPFADLEPEEEPIPVVTFKQGKTQTVVRCTKCKAYINPYCRFTDGGKAWICVVCRVMNNVHQDYFAPLENGIRTDIHERPELNRCTVEFSAPSNYLSGPPQNPNFVFVIDVCYSSVTSGFLKATCEAIKNNIMSIQGEAQIAIITFDQFVHVYNLRSTLAEAKMMVLPELSTDEDSCRFTDDMKLPGVWLPALTEDLLVPLSDSQHLIMDLLDKIPVMFSQNQNPETATGPAICTALKMLYIGGKLVLFTAGLPSLGVGSLKARDNQKQHTAAEELKLLKPASSWYKDVALLASRLQVGVDLFVCAGKQYTDLATLQQLPKYSGGQLFLYNMGMGVGQAHRLDNEIRRLLSKEMGFEAVMRLRLSLGWNVKNLYGNFYQSGESTLMVIPNIDGDKVYGANIVPKASDNQNTKEICIQAAILFTNSNRERRIRIHTAMISVGGQYQQIVNNIDALAVAAMLCRQAIDKAFEDKIDSARSTLVDRNQQFLKEYRQQTVVQQGLSNQPLYLPKSLRCLPLYTLGLLKSTVFSDENTSADLRTFAISKMMNLSCENLLVSMVPRLWGLPGTDQDECIPLPPTKTSLSRNGMFLLDNTTSLVLWIGKMTPHPSITALFGDPPAIDTPQRLNNPLNIAFWEVVDACRSRNVGVSHQPILLVKEDSPQTDIWFNKFLVEDETCKVMSYGDMLLRLQRSVSQSG
eukprot:TRINITY_DN770_c0_g1_i1.p1 TRINITY_DN770_c0_g1~~TRINITY_DN770_c0_g1_i1.p1  ORF type:complete len:1410 (+),score=304.88 TRINITY_DN770_c0_g1_i1:395-4231(+)